MTKRTMKQSFFTIALSAITFCSAAQTFSYSFETDNEGWVVDYADYPVLSVADSVSFYELIHGHALLPAYIVPNQYGIKVRGNNHSDDLFMFIKRKVSGLSPYTTYKVYFNIEMASNAPTNAFGVGGSPGEGVTVKAGVTLTEPSRTVVAGDYRMNINKSNQASPGPDMDTLGHIGVSDTTTMYALIHRNNFSHPFTFTTDASGEAWLIVGTESGYESVTELYYANLNVHFSNPSSIDHPGYGKQQPTIYPNPATDWLSVQSETTGNFSITDMQGRVQLSGIYDGNGHLDIRSLPPGVYIFNFTASGSSGAMMLEKK